MGLLDRLTDVLAQYTGGATPTGDAGEHFQRVAQTVDSGTLATGIAAAMRSDQTPPFSQMVSQLFSSGSSDQKMAMLNTLLASLSPEQRAQVAAQISGLGGAASVTSQQAGSVAPTAVQNLARHAEQQDAGIVDKMSALYAAHPTLVKALGTSALVIAMRTIAEQHR